MIGMINVEFRYDLPMETGDLENRLEQKMLLLHGVTVKK
jgi:hypothetical protein